MATRIRAMQAGILPQMCGVGWSGLFRNSSHTLYPTISKVLEGGGAGWHVASFTNHPVHGEEFLQAYEELKKRWKIAFQTPARINTRTGLRFIFVVYDTKCRGGDVNKKYSLEF